MARTLVFFHAHPDDEALLTAGSMAKAAAAGHRVVLVVATRGEQGDADPALGGGGVDPQRLGALRMAELERSAEILGVARVALLGYADSGSDGTGPAGPSGPVAVPAGNGSGDPSATPFCAVGVDEAAAQLTTILTEEGADLLTSYDPNGGYGHPDHRQVHRVGARAAALTATPVLEATIDRELLSTGITMARSLGYEIPEEFAGEHFEDWFTPSAALTHAIDVRDVLDAKREAMRAHVSQTTSATGATRTLSALLALPEEYFAMAFGTEWYRDPAVAPGGERHHDLLATVEAREP